MYKTLVRERDGRMTDNEIIKYLEQAIDKYNKNEIFVDNIRLDKLSLDLIKRQQAEIEMLRSVQLVQANRIAELRSTKFEQINVIQNLKQQLITSKSEAVKEFAERLKKVWFDNGYESPDVDFEDFVDNLVKEMVGDTE